MKLSNKSILKNIRRNGNTNGFRNPATGKDIETEKLPKAVIERINNSKIDAETYEKMLLFAKNSNWLAGNRELKLNDKRLESLVVYSTDEQAPLTDRTGLRGGGIVSLTDRNGSSKPLKRSNPAITIKNNNRLKNNPNPTSFKNNFKLK